MRVPYNSRRSRSVKKSKASALAVAPPAVSILMDVVEEPEEDMFDFISIDDDSTRDDSSTSCEQQSPPGRCDSTSSLYPIKEQQQSKLSNSDVAVGILEDFFFGSGSTSGSVTDNMNQEQQHCSTHADSFSSYSGSSPTSTILLPPVCSCSQLSGIGSSPSLSIHHQHYYPSTNSLPASPQSMRPKRPSLKQGSSNSLSLMTNSKRNVSFTDISVREYDVELSDHPSCSYGPPIQLGWAYQEAATTSVEDYEVTRSPHRREIHELVLSYNTRRRRLKQSGYKKKEIKKAQREVERIKRERLITEFFLPASAIDEILERLFENVKGWFQPRQRCEAVVCQIRSPQLHRPCPSQQQLLQPQ